MQRLLLPATVLAWLALCGVASAQGADCSHALPAPADGAPRVQVAAWMASGAAAAGLPGELPIMGALVASGMTNLPPGSGTGDEAGYFAMRTSIWNAGPYAGFPERPELQLRWFTDQARAARPAGGPTTPEAEWGEWVADVLRPPEQSRGAYQLRLGEARELIAAGCTASSVPASAPAGAVPPPGGPAGTGTADAGGTPGAQSITPRQALATALAAWRQALARLDPGALRRRGATTVAFAAPARGTLTATLAGPGGLPLAVARRAFASARSVRVRVLLTRAGRRLLARRRSVRVTLRLRFAAAATGQATTVSGRTTLRRRAA